MQQEAQRTTANKKTNLILRDVAQLVARVLWEHDVAGSNPVIPTISSVHNESDEHSIFFAYNFLFGAGFLLFFLLLCRGGQIVNRNALSALKGDLSLSVPFGNLQAAYKTIMDDHALCAVLTCSLDLINLDLFDQFTKDHRVQRFHFHKTPYRLDKVLLGLALLRKAIEFFA